MRGANLKQIAAVAGVSLATASRVLSGSTYPVKAELRQRVLTAADKLYYVPNAAAQGLLRGRSQNVGVLVGDVADPYFSGMISGIHAYADEIDHMVTIINTYRSPEAEVQAFRRLHAQRVDWPASQLSVDNHTGARRMGEHLRSLGHRRVALLIGDPRLNSTSDRLSGYREALGNDVIVVEAEPTRNGGHQVALDILKNHPDVTAIGATADQMAFGALVALREQGLSVPGDISVAGFNGPRPHRASFRLLLTGGSRWHWDTGPISAMKNCESPRSNPSDHSAVTTFLPDSVPGTPPSRREARGLDHSHACGWPRVANSSDNRRDRHTRSGAGLTRQVCTRCSASWWAVRSSRNSSF